MLTSIKEEVDAHHEVEERPPEAEDLSEIEQAAPDGNTKASSLNQLIARQYKFQETARDHRTVQVKNLTMLQNFSKCEVIV